MPTRRFEIADASMLPGLHPGDYIVARLLSATPRRGELVVFTHPHRPGFFLVKRVIGLPGESVVITPGAVAIDGRTRSEAWAFGPLDIEGSWQIGPGQVFVLSDNRSLATDDSRNLGPVGGPLWRAVFRYWPLGRLSRLDSQTS